jgi:type VI secretion system protein ImpJ
VLSTNATSDTGAQSFKIAEFDCRPDGVWVLNPGFIPPLLLIGTSPFFESIRLRMDSMLRTLRQALLSEVQENYLAASSNAAGRIALRGLFSLQALLVDLKSGVRIHPYELFSALRSLYIDVCVHRDVLPGEIEKPYRHDDIAGSFEVILERLEEQAQISRQSIPYTEFARKDGLLRCELGKDIRRAKDVFLLVQKPQVTGKIDLARVKLASESRIDLVYERSLRGIPFQSLENPPFQHGLANTVDFYSITPGQEWDYAVREGTVVFFDAPALTGCRFYLYWRSE